LFVECDDKNGKYVIRLYYNNEWQNVTIDDRIPCSTSGQPSFGHNALKNEMWVVLLEKAVAKLLGGYQALDGGYLEEGVAMLTGGRPERIYVNLWGSTTGKQIWRKDKLWDKLVSYNNENVLMGCAISSGREQADEAKGLVAGHAYGLLDVRETQDKKNKLLKLRNPWGQFEWKGNWSDSSRKWTTAYRKELGQETKDDGIFWMEFSEFCQYYDKITCVRMFNDSVMGLKSDQSVILDGGNKVLYPDASWNRKKVAGEWNGDNAGGMASKLGFAKNPHLKLTVKQAGRVFLMIHRPALSMDADAQYYRTGIGFTIHQGLNSDYTTIPQENSPTSVLQYPVYGRYNSIELELEADVYIVTPITLYPNRRSMYTFEVYSNVGIELESLDSTSVREVPPSARNSRAENREQVILKTQPSQLRSTNGSSGNNRTLSGTQGRTFANTQANKTSSSQPRKTNFTTTYQFEFSNKR
jgi:hypothetical protein